MGVAECRADLFDDSARPADCTSSARRTRAQWGLQEEGLGRSDPTEPEPGDAPTANPGAERRTRGIRFSGSEWEEVKAAAEMHGKLARDAEALQGQLQGGASG